MKRNLQLISAVLLFSGFTSFGQTSANTHVAPEAVTKHAALTEISGKITAKESLILQGSRSTAQSQSSELKELYTTYSATLNEQIKNTTSEKELKELNQELRYAEKRKAELTPANR